MLSERRTIDRIFRLITHLASSQGEVGIKGISESLGLAPSTVHRLIQQFVSLGLMQRVPGTHRYEFGAEMYRLGARISGKSNLVQIALPALTRIVQRTQEGCALGLFKESDLTLVFAHYVESPQSLRYRIELYEPVSVLWGSSGRSVLAFLDPEIATKLARSRRRSPTGVPPVSALELSRELALIRERGYAVSKRGEKIGGAAGVSAPFFGAGGRVVGCLSLTIPVSRYPDKREDAIGRTLVLEAKAISSVLAGMLPG